MNLEKHQMNAFSRNDSIGWFVQQQCWTNSVMTSIGDIFQRVDGVINAGCFAKTRQLFFIQLGFEFTSTARLFTTSICH